MYGRNVCSIDINDVNEVKEEIRERAFSSRENSEISNYEEPFRKMHREREVKEVHNGETKNAVRKLEEKKLIICGWVNKTQLKIVISVSRNRI